MRPRLFHPMLIVAPAIMALSMTIPTTAHADGPSFDCSKAHAKDEIAICSSSELSMLDTLMNQGVAFLRQHSGNEQANQIARPLLSARQSCGGDISCVMAKQLEAIKAYQQLGAPLTLPDGVSVATPSQASDDGMPKKVGECTGSTIDEIGPRLEGDGAFESGTSIGYANGGSQVSYDTEWAIVGSKLGDPVRICLTSIPKGCPPGDDRGKEYKVTNTRTFESWELPDSQHECGGA